MLCLCWCHHIVPSLAMLIARAWLSAILGQRYPPTPSACLRASVRTKPLGTTRRTAEVLTEPRRHRGIGHHLGHFQRSTHKRPRPPQHGDLCQPWASETAPPSSAAQGIRPAPTHPRPAGTRYCGMQDHTTRNSNQSSTVRATRADRRLTCHFGTPRLRDTWIPRILIRE